MIHLVAIKTAPRRYTITTSDVRDKYAHLKAPGHAYMADRRKFESLLKNEIKRPDKLITKMRESGREGRDDGNI